MKTLNQIKSDQLTARLQSSATARVKVNVLTTLIGEVELQITREGPATRTDDKIEELTIATVKKFVKNNDETLAVTTTVYNKMVLEEENEILKSYLPKQLTQDQLREILTAQFKEPVAMGVMMGWLKQTYAGQYDGKDASAVAKSIL